MMPQAEQYPFVSRDSALGPLGLVPCLPIQLSFRQRTVLAVGLLDTAAAISVLPYDVGLQLGAVWEEQTTPLELTGNLARQEARALLLGATVGAFPSVRLAFAWTKSNAVPMLLGQMNFFMEFNVCFFRSQTVFEVKPK
jgi:hypothetical protein